MNIILVLILVALVGVLLTHAFKLGAGETNAKKLFDGLKKYFDLSYQSEAEEDEQIAHALDALARRIVAKHGDRWMVVAENGTDLRVTDGNGNTWTYHTTDGFLRVYKRDD